MPSVTDGVDAELRLRPHLREALADGVANVAATARSLAIDASEAAVVSAVRRLAPEVSDDPTPTPRVRVDRDPGETAGADPDGAVAVHADGVGLAHHRAALGRLGALGVGLRATTAGPAGATYLVDADDLHRALSAIERPADAAVVASIDSSGPWRNDG
ncbi:MAG: hypothetical protein ACLFM8_09085 [Halobacteriales archaeon]